jgi:hypothetical protein
MRRFFFLFVILALVTLGFTFFLIIRPNNKQDLNCKKTLSPHNNKRRILYEYKEISYKEAYDFLICKAGKHPNLSLRSKSSIICFWDSTIFDNFRGVILKDLDSITEHFGRYRFNYIYATEMDEGIAKTFLNRKGINTKFEVMGDMDDFISGVYNECPKLERMMYLGDLKNYEPLQGIKKRKSKPLYMIMDTKGKILYYTNKYYLPSKDTSFLRIAKSLIVR